MNPVATFVALEQKCSNDSSCTRRCRKPSRLTIDLVSPSSRRDRYVGRCNHGFLITSTGKMP